MGYGDSISDAIHSIADAITYYDDDYRELTIAALSRLYMLLHKVDGCSEYVCSKRYCDKEAADKFENAKKKKIK